MAVATCGLAMLWSTMGMAGTNNSMQQIQRQIKRMQQQIQQQKHQIDTQQKKIEKLESLVQRHPEKSKSENTASSSTEVAESEQAGQPQKQHKPNQSLKLGGILTEEYQVLDSAKDNTTGGRTTQGVFAVNAKGQYKNLTFALEQRLSQNSFADPTYLHYGWIAYDLGAQQRHRIKAGFFRVPFGNLPIGYQTFWGNLAYFAGFTDNQAAGLGYRYETGGWRFDLDAFKDDDLGQHSLYGSNPFEGYNQMNGGNARLAYTFHHGGNRSVQLSLAARGGQLAVGGNDANGDRWAGTAAVDAELGPWSLQGQFIDYQYNIPSGQSYADNSVIGSGILPNDSITVENYGYGYQIPASGQLYSLNIARSFDLGIGPFDSIQFYDNYGYLRSGEGDYDSLGNRIGDVQLNAAGFVLSSGPLLFYFDVISGRNAAMASAGPNDGDWHTRYNLTIGLYFDGTVFKK